ncbi:MAG: hypothetical protein SPF00_01105 [Candidatus Egerieousia sp.]|nr:hypothetical protein [Candidatus Egerieousia sp.]
MKKRILLAVLALVAAFTSCSKSEMPNNDSTDPIKLNITVAGLSSETKAVKSSWVNGDKLNLYFNGWNKDATEENYQSQPDMILIYDGSKWKIQSQVSSLSTRLKNSGEKFTVFWESTNNLMSFTNEYDSYSVWYYTPKNNNQDTVYHTPMLVYSAGIDYTFDGTTLTANVSSWKFDDSKFKVLVKTDLTNANNFVLQVKVVGGESPYAVGRGSINVDRSQYVYHINTGGSNTIGMQGAVAESDGLAFYYNSFEATNSDVILFTLIDTANGEKRQYSVTGKTITFPTENPAEPYEHFKAISIDYSKFK